MKFERINDRQYTAWLPDVGCVGYIQHRTNRKWSGHGSRGIYHWSIDELPTRLMVAVALAKMYEGAT
ncbi:hypothetical protein LCGC14_3020950 [marine sediment metagenome]|uniref:Uncharacterized protein n=1 Tax=marine sediment metagenome TaxID=412755 RepID=A0A0F8WVC6_9ZZZZ